MAIKKLQNNFTTPEQSKRLLELGVPADSADMLWDGSIDANEGWVFEDFPTYTDKPFSYYQLLYREEDVVHILPCWSVGRLIEIYLLAVERNTLRKITMHDCTLVESVLQNFEEIQECIEEGVFDFSKLEE